MQIGEFAKICNTKISVLRHYDKEGLLSPDYVDKFTGYRYYSEEKIPIFVRITALKKAGFTLLEIKEILSSCQSNDKILALFESKRAELAEICENLREAEKMILTEEEQTSAEFFESGGNIYARSGFFSPSYQNEMRNKLERVIVLSGYQRISAYKTHGEQCSDRVYLSCEVVKLSENARALCEEVNTEFEDDPSVVGKWETVGEYAVKEDFYENVCPEDCELREIYFLPKGQRYWCYSWSKGKLIFRSEGASYVNEFHIEEYGGSRYMFVMLKSYEYRRGGRPTVLVLRQIDNIEYSPEDIVKKDDIDLPFIPDDRVLGKWAAIDFCLSIDDFKPDKKPWDRLFFKGVEFRKDGEIISVYENKTVHGEHMQSWTKGYVLCKFDHTACEYRILNIDGNDYLFIEWKSGDYAYGYRPPQYYVFKRASE